jgi:hypothetical protein
MTRITPRSPLVLHGLPLVPDTFDTCRGMKRLSKISSIKSRLRYTSRENGASAEKSRRCIPRDVSNVSSALFSLHFLHLSFDTPGRRPIFGQLCADRRSRAAPGPPIPSSTIHLRRRIPPSSQFGPPNWHRSQMQSQLCICRERSTTRAAPLASFSVAKQEDSDHDRRQTDVPRTDMA